MSSEKREVPARIRRQLCIWDWEAYILRILHALITIIAIASSFLVAAKIDTFQWEFIEWLPFISALSMGLLSSFDLGSKANKMRRAWRKLHTAVILFEEDKSIPDERALDYIIETYAEAEEIYGDWKEKIKSE